MNDTTWSPIPLATRPHTPRLAGNWRRTVLNSLHRALDAALRAGDLKHLGPATLTDLGYRRD